MCEWVYRTRIGLHWVGGQYYKTVDKFIQEAREMGISRRIKSVPHGFRIGVDWIALAHNEVCEITPIEAYQKGLDTTKKAPGIFMVFKPTEVQYVVIGNEDEEKLQNLKKRGITPVEIRTNHTEKDDYGWTQLTINVF